MKKIITFFVLAIFIVGNISCPAFAKKSSGGGLSDGQLMSFNSTVDRLTQKYYSRCYFSPADAANLIGIKIKLDDAMLMSPDPKYAPLYYKIGRILQRRGRKDEAIECFQAITDNFPDTAIAPRAGLALKSLGVSVNIPQKGGSGDDE